jgi:eukaryotic-like serine/threonine-protein kinase
MAKGRGVSMLGETLGHYRILEKIAEGGMGVVYKARDTHLDRFVAIKVLPPERVADPDRKRRFVQEAKAASALNHPNIVTIHDIDVFEGVHFIVMEHVDGMPLDRVIAGKGLPVERALHYALQIAEALAAAHAAGIVHRDIKPANIMIAGVPSGPGRAKVLDFGLAKLTERSPSGETTESAEAATRAGAILGTVAYMSPEQAEGKPVDARSDVFSFGTVLYEMLAGRRPFQGESHLSTLAAILRDPPPPLEVLRPDVPEDVRQVLGRCLEKNREARYPSATGLRDDLADCCAPLAAPRAGWRAVLRRPRFAIPVLLAILALVAGVAWMLVRNSRARWAREVALPEANRLAEKMRTHSAWQLIREAEPYVPNDPQMRHVQDIVSHVGSIHTTPPGADVYVTDYDDPSGWELLGRSPLDNLRIPAGYLRFRVSKPGFETAEAALLTAVRPNPDFTLEPLGSAPVGMVRVPAGTYQLGGSSPVELAQYWLDKYEVTNRQFKEFIDRGGYQKREYWKQPFIENGRSVFWNEAMLRFRDATGRPGPSTWELASYPEGRADFPVSGVSWYEAAAYAEFADKSLPAVYHWNKAAGRGDDAGLGVFSNILLFSNFGGKGPARVGSFQGLSEYGAYDMAGNVKEWCWNEAGGSKRYILGGAWNEPAYQFTGMDAQAPFDRSATYGFRCAKYSSALPESLLAPIKTTFGRDYSKEKPAGAQAFQLYKSIYAYDRGPLDARVESVDDSSPHWRKEKVAFNAAYGGERMMAYLFLPKNAAPPYQTVVYFPGGDAALLRSSENLGLEMLFVDFVIRGGRAVLYPIYKGTYERHVDVSGHNAERDLTIQSVKDVSRSIDYLETRSDINPSKLAFYGLSMGADFGASLCAIEGRLKTFVLLAGSLPDSASPPEIDPINFASQAKAPLLMLNGRYDFECPVESCSKPLFDFWGAPKKDKRMVVYESGHAPAKMQDVIREILDWLDRYLGPVKTAG